MLLAIQEMLIDEVKECSKCGICRSVCPVFLEINDEVMSPRGRISLIEALLEGGLSHSERYVDTIRSCIRCTRCSSVCPSGISVERIVQSARDLLAENVGIPDAAREVFRSILLDPASFRACLLSHSPAPSPPRPLAPSLPRLPLWQLPLFFHEGARLPQLAAETALDKYPEYVNSGSQGRIALFVGCSMNYVHTDIAHSAIEVLKRLNVDIFLPKEQLCCGAPAMLFGDRDGARELAKRNLAALRADEFDAVVTLCPACGVTLKREYEHILGGDIGGFTSKVYDISEFIDKFTDYKTHRADMAVTYHDPCYLRLGQEVEAEPRRILGKSARFIEMEDADKCCGLGGTLGLFHPELSVKMGEAKIKSIVESGVDVVATGCPGCILFLREQLAERGIQKDVLHTVQVLQKSLELLT
jgi:glycolate oxidase iron-sulfur subunit